MSSPKRMFAHREAYFVSNRTVCGLPFVACLYINLLIYGILARARELYPDVSICAWLFMSNHYHGIVVTHGDPAMLAAFMNFVNGETGKIVTRLLGQRNYKVWAHPYHAAQLGDYRAMIEKLAYVYLNPVYAYLVAKAADWCGVTTWHEFQSGCRRQFKYIKPSLLAPLPNNAISKKLCARLVEAIEKLPMREIPFIIEPFSWKTCFPESRQMADKDIENEICALMTAEEKRIEKERIKTKKQVVGIEALAQQNPHRNYRPRKFGRRVFCIVSCPELRKQLIDLYQEFCAKCQEAWEAWKCGDLTAKYPPGAFLPPRRPPANILLVPI